MSTFVRPLSIALTVLASSLLPQVAHAATLSFQVDDVGIIHTINAGSPEAAAGFIMDERLLMQFSFDDAIADADADADAGNYSDASATLTLIGKDSGATLSYLGGLSLIVEEDALEITGLPSSATAGQSPVLAGELELETSGAAFFSNVNDLSTVFADLLASPFPNNSASLAATEFFNGSSTVGIQFGPASASTQFSLLPADPSGDPTATTPEPTSFIALVAVLLGGVRCRRR